MPEPKWGIVSTVKAPLREVLGFAAYHLQRGAHRLYIYLDAPEPDTFDALKAHPKVRVTACDAGYWTRKGGRPLKHQPRQTKNASDAYAKRAEVDWLLHIDHDEFLVSDTPIAARLADLPDTCLCARIRAVEALDWDGAETEPRPFKGFTLDMPTRRRITEKLYPTYGKHLNGGFLSHVAGKMIYRTALEGFHVKIHNALLGDEMNPGQVELEDAKLCHLHGASWDAWRLKYAYRLKKGAYRAELKAPFDHDKGGLSMHDLLSGIEADGGKEALRAFHQEVSAASPALLQGLKEHGLLHWHTLDLDSAIAAEFPDYA